MAKLYLVRHGECENNIQHIWGGDSLLTPRGENQSREIASYLKNLEFDTIYHSTRKRAVKTAEIIAESKPGVELVPVPALVERDYGQLEGLTLEETDRKFPGMKPRDAVGLYYGKIGGENYEDIRNRVRAFLEKLRSKESPSALVAHQMTNRAILGELLSLPLEKIPFILIPNDCIYEIDLGNSNQVGYIQKGVRKEGLLN